MTLGAFCALAKYQQSARSAFSINSYLESMKEAYLSGYYIPELDSC